ncbi:TetR/AcrR family transcriptional regulator [Kineococcus gynurae]|uniref:TetR/AcrR family transcriptional regulator n=1 Tax=Kineococcus gynurae TaxID=452979 RepID=A0ABV5LT25_9ACTN
MTITPDRYAAVKARHRAAILAAATAVLTEGGVPALSADVLAARADVARRTIFNHFASLEDVVLACLEDELNSAISSVADAVDRSPTGGAQRGPLDDLETSLRGTDLPRVVSRIARMLEGPGSSEHELRLQQQAMAHLAGPMTEQVRHRHPDLSALDAALVTGSVLSGLTVVARVWLEETGGSLDPAGRRRWEDLLDHLFRTLRHGFSPAPLSPEGL